MALSHAALLEAILFASGESLSRTRVAKLLDCSAKELDAAVTELDAVLSERGLALVQTEDELELRTAAGASSAIQALRESELSKDLGKASLETLAMILYRGSATRGEIDWVRGVNSAAAIRSLTLRGLIERTEDAADKRRARYKPTVDALAHLGVSKKEDLPRYSEFTTALDAEEAKIEEDV